MPRSPLPRALVHRALAATSLALGLALGTPVLLPSVAQATVLAELSFDQRVDAAEYIVRGTVVDVWTEVDGNGLVWTRVQLDVAESLKGPAGDTLVLSEPGGTYGSIRTVVAGSAVFSVGEEILAFASERGEGRIQLMGLSRGKFILRLDPVSRSMVAQQWAPPGNQPYDHRFVPPPREGSRVFLDDMLDDIRARLDLGWDGQPIPGIPTERLYRTNKLQPGVK